MFEPFRLTSPYGLFAVMTTTRDEIIVEGSDDGVHWREYQFRYKPGDVNRRPPWNIPHQPRLDWQMWFAALGGAGQNPWFSRFLERLLEERRPLGIVVVAVVGQAELERQQVRRRKAGLFAAQPLDRAREQARADEQHKRERKLRDDERASCRAAGTVGRALGERVARAHSRGVPRRRDAANERRDEHQREDECDDGGVDFDILNYRLSSGAVTVNIATNTASGGHAASDVIANF